jgi:DNA-binding MarR family transcriptional regulator
MSNSINYDAVSFAIRSKFRKIALKALADGPATPSDIEKRTETDIAHISRALGELRERGLVELLVSEDTQKGRFYGLTDEGREVADIVQERDQA